MSSKNKKETKNAKSVDKKDKRGTEKNDDQEKSMFTLDFR